MHSANVGFQGQRLNCAHKKTRIAGFFVGQLSVLLEVFANQTSHFEHGHLGFAKNSLELVVGVDGATVHAVLQVVFFDVDPHFAHHLSAGQRRCTHHSCQCGAGR